MSVLMGCAWVIMTGCWALERVLKAVRPRVLTGEGGEEGFQAQRSRTVCWACSLGEMMKTAMLLGMDFTPKFGGDWFV